MVKIPNKFVIDQITNWVEPGAFGALARITQMDQSDQFGFGKQVQYVELQYFTIALAQFSQQSLNYPNV